MKRGLSLRILVKNINKKAVSLVVWTDRLRAPGRYSLLPSWSFIFIRSYGTITEGFNIAKQININNFNDFVKNSFANYLQTCNKRAYI
jgi:hypothetical protein